MKIYQYKGYELRQSFYNWHYVIIDLKTQGVVLHCSHDKELSKKEMKTAIKVYLFLVDEIIN